MTELADPLAVRRAVSFSEAVLVKRVQVEGVTGEFVLQPGEVKRVLQSGAVPVLVDPDLVFLDEIKPDVVVDARMQKAPPREGKEMATLVIGLGPGFKAGENAHAVIETKRGHHLGRVIWSGPPGQHQPARHCGRLWGRACASGSPFWESADRSPDRGSGQEGRYHCHGRQSGSFHLLTGSCGD